MNTCSCGHPTELYGCRVCAERLADQLGDVPALIADLDVTTARLARMGTGGKRGAETPLVFHPQASDARTHLTSVLRTWAAHVATHRGKALDLTPPLPLARRWQGRAVIPNPPAIDQASLAARWLLNHLQDVRSVDAFPFLARGIDDAVRDARRAIDRPADRVYAGPCDGSGATQESDEEPCGEGLYAGPEDPWVQCRTCGREYDVANRRQWMRDDLRDYLGSSRQVARIVTALGVKVSESTVRSWVRRGKLQAREWLESVKEDGRPRPQYRVADILAVAMGEVVDYETVEAS